MLNVGKIEEGFVLDHIQAGKSMRIYHHLGLDRLDCPVAIIKNARSNKSGVKDILKVECDIDTLDLDVLAFIDHNITVNVIKCTNPRCITSIERGLPHIFYLSDKNREIYRCRYCDERYSEHDAEAWNY